jgi:hypothetical protein
MKYYADLESQLKALTPEQVLAAFRKHIASGKLVIAVAGDFAKKGGSGTSKGGSSPPQLQPGAWPDLLGDRDGTTLPALRLPGEVQEGVLAGSGCKGESNP